MIIIRASSKREGGKLVDIEVKYDDHCRIVEAIISGDFFAYPPEAVEILESCLKGCDTDSCVGQCFEVLGTESTLLGLDIRDIEELLKNLFERCREELGTT